MQDIISTLKNALQQAEAGLEVAVGRLAKDGTERGDFKPSEVLALASVREVLAMPVTCLHRIQEPAATEQSAWHAGLDEGRAQATGSVSNATFQAAPAAWVDSEDDKPSSRADLERVLDTWNEATGALPRDSGWRCEVLGMLEDAYDLGAHQAPQAAPAAVAVADERAAFEDWATDQMDIMSTENCFDRCKITGRYQYAFVESKWEIWQARAALAATPAAAPVVLPEPAAIALSRRESATKGSVEFTWGIDAFKVEGPRALYTEQQVRALLAQAATAGYSSGINPKLEWDEVYDCAIAAYSKSSTSTDALRLCFQSRSQQQHISICWTANELMDFAQGIASLVASSSAPVAWINWNAATGERSVGFKRDSELASEPLYSNPAPQAQADARDAERWRAAREGVKSGDRVIHVYTAQHGLGTKLLGSAADAEIDAAIAAAKGE